jgi:hypothetical protein
VRHGIRGCNRRAAASHPGIGNSAPQPCAGRQAGAPGTAIS